MAAEHQDIVIIGGSAAGISAAQTLVERSILALEASKLGLLVSKGEIERAVVQSPGFRGPDGRFDKEAFERFVQYGYGTVASVEGEDLRNALLAELAAERELEQVPLEAETLEGARVFEGSHRIPQPTAGSE